MKNAMVNFMATFCVAIAITVPGYSQQKTDQLFGPYSGLRETSGRRTDGGWIPNARSNETSGAFSTRADAPRGSFPRAGTREAERRESLRRSYRGYTVRRTSRNPYARQTTPSKALASAVDCDCGENCKCPPHVCKNGDCLRNYAIMISATWCSPCKRMYPVVEELRKEGYKIYVYTIDTEEFRDLDAKYNVSRYPTFIVFNKGKETKRRSGITKPKWFSDNLTVYKDEDDEEDTNPYDL